MSETTVAKANTGSDSQASAISEVTIRLAGNSQDGIQSIGGFPARLAGRRRAKKGDHAVLTGGGPLAGTGIAVDDEVWVRGVTGHRDHVGCAL